MFELIPLTSWDLPDLAPYRTLRRPLEHRKQGIFFADGEKVVRRMLESSIEVISLMMPPSWIEIYRPILERRAEMIRVYSVEKTVLEELTGATFYQGVIGFGKIPPLPLLEELLQKSPIPDLWIAIDQIVNAGNIGLICRSAAAFGVQGVILGENACPPYIRWAIHSSMGEIFKLQIAQPPSLLAVLKIMKSRGIRCIAAHPHAEGKVLSQLDLKGPICFIFGSEGKGVTPEILAECDESVAIPMAFGVDSLNVANCAGIFLYEAQRQRLLISPD